jgi:hypothetical protein
MRCNLVDAPHLELAPTRLVPDPARRAGWIGF